MSERLVLEKFDRPRLFPGCLFIIRQGRRSGTPMLQHLLGRDHRRPVLFLVSADGRACWRHGVEPTRETQAKAQLHLDRRFCGEKRA